MLYLVIYWYLIIKIYMQHNFICIYMVDSIQLPFYFFNVDVVWIRILGSLVWSFDHDPDLSQDLKYTTRKIMKYDIIWS